MDQELARILTLSGIAPQSALYEEESDPQPEQKDPKPSGWMFFAEFLNLTLEPQVGQRVRVHVPGGFGRGDHKYYETIKKVTATRITLEDGTAYKRFDGKQIGSWTKSDRSSIPSIWRILVPETE